MKKRCVLKNWVKQALAVVAVILILVLSTILLNKLDEKFMKSCMSNGYSQNYCERRK